MLTLPLLKALALLSKPQGSLSACPPKLSSSHGCWHTVTSSPQPHSLALHFSLYPSALGQHLCNLNFADSNPEPDGYCSVGVSLQHQRGGKKWRGRAGCLLFCGPRELSQVPIYFHHLTLQPGPLPVAFQPTLLVPTPPPSCHLLTEGCSPAHVCSFSSALPTTW